MVVTLPFKKPGLWQLVTELSWEQLRASVWGQLRKGLGLGRRESMRETYVRLLWPLPLLTPGSPLPAALPPLSSSERATAPLAI